MNIFRRLLLFAILSAICLMAGRFLPPGWESGTLLSVPAARITAAAAVLLLVWFAVVPALYRLLESLYTRLFTISKIRRSCRSAQRSLLNWLLSRPAHWGITGTASDIQYSNTCEGLLALQAAGYQEKKRESYRTAFHALLDAVLPTGLPSRTVNRPTVINTAMLLELITLEKKSSNGIVEDYMPFDDIAANLWFLHADEGWGILIDRPGKKECRLVNTWWALRALYHYGYLDIPEEAEAFRKLLIGMFEKNRGGTFGYSASDAPRLTVTAMYLLLYYELPRRIREEIRRDYDPQAAASFIYERFVIQKCQTEVENVDGTFAGGTYIAHTPWKHISSSFAMQALAEARKNKDLSPRSMTKVYLRTAEILESDLRSPAAGESHYIPADMEMPRTGPYTFAAAYLVAGLQALL